MKRILTGLVGLAMLASAGGAAAQPWDHDRHDRDRYEHRGDHWRDNDRGWRDRGRHYGWRRHHYAYPYRAYGYRYAPVRECAWRFGERVCWWRR
jgi:hypothetical protein